MFWAPVLSSMLMPPYVSQGPKYPLKWFASICLPVHLLMCSEKLFLYYLKWGRTLEQVIWVHLSVSQRRSAAVNLWATDLCSVSCVSSGRCDLYLSITGEASSINLTRFSELMCAVANSEKRLKQIVVKSWWFCMCLVCRCGELHVF